MGLHGGIYKALEFLLVVYSRILLPSDKCDNQSTRIIILHMRFRFRFTMERQSVGEPGQYSRKGDERASGGKETQRKTQIKME